MKHQPLLTGYDQCLEYNRLEDGPIFKATRELTKSPLEGDLRVFETDYAEAIRASTPKCLEQIGNSGESSLVANGSILFEKNTVVAFLHGRMPANVSQVAPGKESLRLVLIQIHPKDNPGIRASLVFPDGSTIQLDNKIDFNPTLALLLESKWRSLEIFAGKCDQSDASKFFIHAKVDGKNLEIGLQLRIDGYRYYLQGDVRQTSLVMQSSIKRQNLN